MIQTDKLNQAVTEYLNGKEMLFPVSVTISKDNDIEVVIDTMDGSITLDQCVDMNKFIESKLDRNVEDFSLTVGSAGLTAPFTVMPQYGKAVGSEIEITRKNGERVKCLLERVDEEKIAVAYSRLVKVEGKKKKQSEEVKEVISFSDIKSAKPIINFKK